MLIFLITHIFAMDQFLQFFPAGSYEGVNPAGDPCQIHIIDLGGLTSDTTYFQVAIHTDEFPEYPFVYVYEEDYESQKTTKLAGDNSYLLEIEGSKQSLANIYFRFSSDFVEIERKGYASRGPRIRCTKK
jgi:hypothetical protein